MSEEQPKRKRGRPRKYPPGEGRRNAAVEREATSILNQLDTAATAVRSLSKETIGAKETEIKETSRKMAEQKATVKDLVQQALTIAGMPPIDMNDPDQVSNRISKYFQLMGEGNTRPTVSGLGAALNGMTRQQLYALVYQGKYTTVYPAETLQLIKSAYSIMEELWESYMVHGTIPPINGIFLGKNHYGYQDKSEVQITKGEVEKTPSLDKIAEKYAVPVSDADVVSDDGEVK